MMDEDLVLWMLLIFLIGGIAGIVILDQTREQIPPMGEGDVSPESSRASQGSVPPFVIGSDGRPPTPRGRCWLAPSRVIRLDQGASTEALNGVCRSRLGCVVDQAGVVWGMEEPLTVTCVAEGRGR